MKSERAISAHSGDNGSMSGLAKLALGAIGVVYGDIGTSPLYAIEECFGTSSDIGVNTPNVLGVLSLVFWALMLVVVAKYLSFIMTADNEGEGGILALIALIRQKDRAHRPKPWHLTLIFTGLFGSALLYGDGVITPAISVLSAVDGLKVATPVFKPYVVPITVAILVGLFLVQRRGTARMGNVFGPITLIWFAAIACAGAPWIIRQPAVLWALNPWHAVRFLFDHGWSGCLVLGAVVLCVTGGEALYADMGHFGKGPIRVAWYAVVFPCLVVNYFGQGAYLITLGPKGAAHPFYGLVLPLADSVNDSGLGGGATAVSLPHGLMLYPMVVIATLAAVVASQALITGVYSLTRQAVQLGYFPRLTIIHTSGDQEGQIYMPEVNAALMVSCVAVVIGFGEAKNLAAAYGIAVTGTMAVTSVLFFEVKRATWGVFRAGALTFAFLLVDGAFLAANAAKLEHGGWFPVAVAATLFIIMTTWKRGRSALGDYIRAAVKPFEAFMAQVDKDEPPRVRGTAVFMTQNPDGVPPVLLHHYKHNKVLHEQVILLTVVTERVPFVPPSKRTNVIDLGRGFFHVTARYGFMQTPNVPVMLTSCATTGLVIHANETSYYLGRESLLTTGRSKMVRWRKHLFAFLSRNARSPTAFFNIPPNRVVELGMQVEL